MKKQNFSVKIKAPKEKVWNVLWNDDSYKKWTATFSEGSHAVSDWKEGSEILFLSPEGEGMYSVIDKKVPNEVMSFKHVGVVKENQKQPLDEESKKWSGAKEEYYLDESGGITELRVEMDITDEHENYFKETFPKALDKVRDLAEH